MPAGALAAALAAVVAPHLPRPAKAVAWAVAAVVAVARVYVGAHLPLDVVGGAGIGLTLGAAVHLLLGPPARRG